MKFNLNFINENIYQFCVINDLLINEEPSLELITTKNRFGFWFRDNEKTNKTYQAFNCLNKLLSQQTYDISQEGISSFFADFKPLIKSICFFSELDIRDFYEAFLQN